MRKIAADRNYKLMKKAYTGLIKMSPCQEETTEACMQEHQRIVNSVHDEGLSVALSILNEKLKSNPAWNTLLPQVTEVFKEVATNPENI
jgi:hypothetical protein